MVFDPHTEVQLVRPCVTEQDALFVARTSYGLEGSVKELGSNQDKNYLFTPAPPAEHGQRYLLKFDNDAFALRELEVQNEAVLLLAAAGISVPAPRKDKAGSWITTVQLPSGRSVRARLLSFVEGHSLFGDGHLFPSVIAELGALAGRVAAELASLADPALERDLQWDMRAAMTVIDAHVDKLAPERQERVRAASRRAWRTVSAVASSLPVQAIHGDITDDNVVGLRDALGRVRPSAVIDWGDLSTGWRVAEIAVSVSSVLHHQRSPLDALPAIAAFDAIVRLSDAEVAALWPLVVLRSAVVVVSGIHQLALEPENTYVAERNELEWRMFETADSIEPQVALAAIEAAIGRAPPIPSTPEQLLLSPDFGRLAEYVRLDSASPHLHRGAFLESGTEARLAAAEVARGRAPVFAYAEQRLTRTSGPGSDAPATAALFAEVRVPSATLVVAPFKGNVVQTDDGAVILSGPFGEIDIRGVSAVEGQNQDVLAGTPIARLAADTPCTIQWRLSPVPAPLFTTTQYFPAWRRLTADPALLLGIPGATWFADPEAERERRSKAVPGAAERYYELPPEIERGWRELLFDTTGRAYIDMVNNVSGIGHAHPRLAEAVHQQLLTLNTNNRFLYASLATYVERLAALAPHPSLSAVMLVNSGSEAVDLALRLARAHTRRQAVVCLREAYHGWTAASDAVSTSDWDNPGAEGSRPAWVHVADAVNTYRGKHRGDSAGTAAAYAADVEALVSDMERAGTPPGAFICEPVFGNGGGVVYPAGYLPAVYGLMRRRGALCIADEVQVGLGRLGHATWGVETQGVVPDILVAAKALGNAYPLGCVYTTPAIAASLARDGMFFSSAGGATASAVAGLAVLDVLRDEGLQANAAAVGDHLRTRFAALMSRYPLVGHVHGMGLYQGVELVRDRATREPAVAETEWVCERLLDYGVIIQATSERRNVLKIKPPLTLTKAHADVFADALAAVLDELERRDTE